jgi:hypothetical protein
LGTGAASRWLHVKALDLFPDSLYAESRSDEPLGGTSPLQIPQVIDSPQEVVILRRKRSHVNSYFWFCLLHL